MASKLEQLRMNIELRQGNPHSKANVLQMIVGVEYLLKNGASESELEGMVKSIYLKASAI